MPSTAPKSQLGLPTTVFWTEEEVEGEGTEWRRRRGWREEVADGGGRGADPEPYSLEKEAEGVERRRIVLILLFRRILS